MATQQVLAVDVGNSRAKFGLFEIGAAAVPQVVAVSALRLAEPAAPADVLATWLTSLNAQPARAILAGSNPPVRDQLLHAWPADAAQPGVVLSAADVPVPLDVDQPATVGIDRLLTAYAASRIFATGQPVIVVDSGTATTINLVTHEGVFRGGSIFPGLRLSAHALHDYTARLPLIDTDAIADKVSETEAPIPGRSTEQAMISGLFWGQLGAIRELRARLARVAMGQYKEAQDPVCLVTGGGGRQLSEHLLPCFYVDSLALHGLALLASD
ncbi:MAG: type III pantothenate kinase [Fuerstiella sp.]